MSTLHHDPHWPRASGWLAGEHAAGSAHNLTVIGAPVARGSITPGRCDLAPAAIRAALARYTTYDLDHLRDLRELRVRDAGDLPVAEMTPEQAFAPLRDALAAVEGPVILLGGDNSITRAGVHGLGAPLARCGLITFDAHFDLRRLDGGLTNGNPIRALLRDGLPGANIVQIGIQSFANSQEYARVAREAGIQVVTAGAVLDHHIEHLTREALHQLNLVADRIYVDLDLDVMDRAFAPATPGSRPGGLTPHLVRKAARICGSHSKVRIIDVVEMDPTQDIADVTALTAAACVLEFASGVLGRGVDV
jgi:formiminoglutamase